MQGCLPIALQGFDAIFLDALGRSAATALSVSLLSLAVGWPLGTQLGLTRFPLRKLFIAGLTLPLLLPSFLLAIGLSMLSTGASGVAPTVLAFSYLGIPLVALSTLGASLTLARSQSDAARLAGGQSLLFRLALRSTFPLATLAAALVGTLTLGDPGPGQIFGWQGAASELLSTFAARYDPALASRQALAIAGLAALLSWPIAWTVAPNVAATLLSRDVAKPSPAKLSKKSACVLAVLGLWLALPLAGLLKPLTAASWPASRAWAEMQRTAGDTFLYAAIAAMTAVSIAFVLASAFGHSPSGRRWLAAAALALLALPPSLPALWLIPWSNRLTLGMLLALRGLPVALLFALRATGSMPPSWSEAAKAFHIPKTRYMARVVLPWLARWAIPAAAVSALLANSEVGAALLLHPPGHANLPLALFTIMANAPEALVATLSLFYMGIALAIIILIQTLSRRL